MPGRPTAFALLLATFIALAFPSTAQDTSPKPPAPLENLGPVIEGEMQRLMGILEMFLRSIPTYDMPEILDNGDIIIRRKRPDGAPDEPPVTKDGDTDLSRT